jgi:hypothetical protein
MGIIINLDLEKKELNKEIEKLKEENDKKSKEIDSLIQKTENQTEELKKIKQEYQELLEKIEQSIEWFKENSYIPKNYNWESEILLTRIKKDCFYKNTLNLACIGYLLENTAISIRYKTDEIYEKDHLQSIKQTIDRHGGDCEDYALFYIALLNTLKNESKQKNTTIILWKVQEGKNFIIYPLYREPSDSYWYYKNADEYKSLKLNESYFYAVCYMTSKTEGHCINAISKNKIKDPKEILLLNDADLFEPQYWGEYVGKIGKELELCDKKCNENKINKIIMIISSEEIYYYKDFFGWEGLNTYANKIKDRINSINENN